MTEQLTKILLDNERNLIIYALIGLVLIYLSFNLPLHPIWIYPAILGMISGVLVTAHGVLRYLERREMVLSSEIKIDERHW